MKKTLIATLATAAILASCFNASAQILDRTSFGILGGLTSSSSTAKGADASTVSQYHVGAAVQIPISGGFSIQPGILYQVKGMKLDNWKNSTVTEIADNFQTKVGYLEIPVQIQWGPDLLAFRPYAFAEPFIGFKVSDSSKSDSAKTLSDDLKDVEYGLGLGVGVEFWKLQVSAKYFWNFGDIYKSGSTAYDTIKDAIDNGNNFNGIALSVGFFF